MYTIKISDLIPHLQLELSKRVTWPDPARPTTGWLLSEST